jgi:hypothetical protein
MVFYQAKPAELSTNLAIAIRTFGETKSQIPQLEKIGALKMVTELTGPFMFKVRILYFEFDCMFEVIDKYMQIMCT